MTTSFDETYGRFFAPIRAKCRRMLGRSAAAEDVTQETFVRLWQTGPRLSDGTEARTVLAWLYLTSTRLSVDMLRRGKYVVDAEVEPVTCASSPSDVVSARASIALLVQRVAADEIEAALLTRVDGLSHPEAAFVLGISERTVRRLLARFDEHTADLKKEMV